jgi:hypothetical protein
MTSILAIDPKVYKDNASLIRYGVVPMGYLNGRILDLTYGDGGFWKKWRSVMLSTNDLDETKWVDRHEDFCNTSWPDKTFDSVVFDPPYKLQGTPASPEMDRRYGTREYTSVQKIEELHFLGCKEAVRLSRKYVLVKTMDQVAGGKVHWLTDLVTNDMRYLRASKVTRFFLVGHRAQPKGRGQEHPINNYSSLLVFEVAK